MSTVQRAFPSRYPWWCRKCRGKQQSRSRNRTPPASRRRRRRDSAGEGWDISAPDLARRLQQGNHIRLLDVREPHEAEISSMGAVLIPKDVVRQRLNEIPRDGLVVVHCRTGARSATVVRWLEDEGYTNAVNLAGGINAWAREIDPDILIY